MNSIYATEKSDERSLDVEHASTHFDLLSLVITKSEFFLTDRLSRCRFFVFFVIFFWLD